MKTQATMGILGVVSRGEGKKGYRTRIGTAFRNRGGSLNLRFDYLPADLGATTIQVRERRSDAAEPTAEAPAEHGSEGLRCPAGAARFQPRRSL